MTIAVKSFGTGVRSYTLDGGHSGVRAVLLDRGATLQSLQVTTASTASPVDVVLGFDTIEGYLAHSHYFGATIGR